MAQWIIYAIAIAAFIVPAAMAWRYRAEAARLKSEVDDLATDALLAAAAAKLNYEALDNEYAEYRRIVETSPNTPADVIARLRKSGAITKST